jgi:hypothetical protein
MALAEELGEFLVEVGAEVAKAVANGAPKEAIIAAIKGVQVQVSDSALREELEAADERRRMG